MQKPITAASILPGSYYHSTWLFVTANVHTLALPSIFMIISDLSTRGLRIIDCSISQTFVMHNIDTFNVLQRKSAFSLMSRIYNCDNTQVMAIVSSSYNAFSSSLCNKWHYMLYWFLYFVLFVYMYILLLLLYGLYFICNLK